MLLSNRLFPWATLAVLAALMILTAMAVAAPTPADDQVASPVTAPGNPFVLGPPQRDTIVQADFALHDLNSINEEEETFEFSGVMTLRWRDPRQAFDPTVEGVTEKVFTGDYQFDEVAPGWYPQIVLVNSTGMFEVSGVMLRLQPDGSATLVQSITAAAKADLNMRRFPFDGHRLDAIFEVLGYDKSEVRLQLAPSQTPAPAQIVRIPQWTITELGLSVGDRVAPYAGSLGVSSAWVVSVHVNRNSFYISRLIVVPLIVIVLLSFSVFWMDRSSIGDRLSVSFIGILTCVAYQMVMSDHLPQISYVTLMHGFLNLSFLVMCSTVVINLVVAGRDKRGKHESGDRIDRRCRLLFPAAYFGLMAIMVVVAFTVF